MGADTQSFGNLRDRIPAIHNLVDRIALKLITKSGIARSSLLASFLRGKASRKLGAIQINESSADQREGIVSHCIDPLRCVIRVLPGRLVLFKHPFGSLLKPHSPLALLLAPRDGITAFARDLSILPGFVGRFCQ